MTHTQIGRTSLSSDGSCHINAVCLLGNPNPRWIFSSLSHHQAVSRFVTHISKDKQYDRRMCLSKRVSVENSTLFRIWRAKLSMSHVDQWFVLVSSTTSSCSAGPQPPVAHRFCPRRYYMDPRALPITKETAILTIERYSSGSSRCQTSNNILLSRLPLALSR